MSLRVSELIEKIYASRHDENNANIKQNCSDISKIFSALDNLELSTLFANWISNSVKSNKFLVSIGILLIHCEGKKGDQNLIWIEKLLSIEEHKNDVVLPTIMILLVWIYTTRAFSNVSYIPSCHYKYEEDKKAGKLPHFDGIEHTLLSICSKYFKKLRSKSYYLSLYEEDANSSILQSTSKIKLQKIFGNDRNSKSRFEQLIHEYNKNFDKFPLKAKDQVDLIQTSISIILYLDTHNSISNIWIILGFCESFSGQELKSISVDSICPDCNGLTNNTFKTRINFDEETLIRLCKLIGRCFYILDANESDLNVKTKIYERIKKVFKIILRRSVCEVMPYSSAFISSYVFLINRLLRNRLSA